ncbi:unnamed protein product [Bursaphelenchus okinawaensis]|uniref:BTB domain-containing protein n=1 Tax=Bursaphelenchus okinawaensis TaxID=465554 RepID=A0A811KL97_9BILA|nr:unnamed protein product [Bursaphelenchus okinawaensis]CAG9105785.1 unnamed protein product [Bursaphelenchus okinawaensis]
MVEDGVPTKKMRVDAEDEVKQDRHVNWLRNKEDTFNVPEFNDFKVVCRNNVFYASKLQLVNASPVIHKMLKSDPQKVKIEMLDASPAAVEALLRYIFNGKLIFDFDIARAVLILAAKYEIQSLKDLCEDVLVTQMKFDHVKDLMALSYELDLYNLRSKCFKIGAKATKPPNVATVHSIREILKDQPFTLALSNKFKKNALCIVQENEDLDIEPKMALVMGEKSNNTVLFNAQIKENVGKEEVLPLVINWYAVEDDGDTELCGIYTCAFSFLSPAALFESGVVDESVDLHGIDIPEIGRVSDCFDECFAQSYLHAETANCESSTSSAGKCESGRSQGGKKKMKRTLPNLTVKSSPFAVSTPLSTSAPVGLKTLFSTPAHVVPMRKNIGA